MEVDTKRIVDFKVVQVTEAKTSPAMEKLAFTRCLNRLLARSYKITSIATDCHSRIIKIMRDKYIKKEKIAHKFDMWHYAKSIKKRLVAASRKKNCSPIAEWIPAIINHLWWSSSKCQGDLCMMQEWWQSVVLHITDQHEWDHGILYHGCTHKKYTDEERSLRPWLEKDSQAYLSLAEVVMSKKMTEDLEHLKFFHHTGALEVYNSFSLKYQPKRTHFKMDSMEARTKLAALAHNANVHRQQARV